MIQFNHSKGVVILKPQKGFCMYLKNKDAIIHVRVPFRMRDDLIEVSKRHGMSISAYLRFVIDYHLFSEIVKGGFDMHEDK